MAELKNEKTLGAAVNISLIEAFDQVNMQVFGSGFRKKKLWNAFVRWWIDLPAEEKNTIYELGENAELRPLKSWICDIIDQRMAKGGSSGPDKPVEEQVVEASQNLRHYIKYHIVSGEAARELAALREALGGMSGKKARAKRA